ncbi:DUF2809 domain-containing protein [Sphingomonas sp. H39-1-10]|uniref:ribosomal maturation YjgA family protein n=1 Tax=Sphingomonas TaxID=13687 RepID=UPI000B8548FA|nr:MULTISPECIES: DUF2809 domain-containing protein [Sphingomonas]MDF0486940.1 DUF2809 domain-containing protein [Sphingomonas pollutisoli]
MTLRLPYAFATLAFLTIEAAIVLFVHDRFVRPHVGDALAVVLVYLALRTVTRLPRTGAVLAAFAIACAAELGQAYDLVGRLGLARSTVARVVLGTGFDPWDFLAYLAGAAIASAGDPRASAPHQLPKPGASLAPPGPSRVTRAAP